MRLVLAAAFLTMTACAIDPMADPESLPPEHKPIGSERAAPNDTADVSRFLARSITCVKQMRVSGVGPYSVQCAVGYFATDSGVQLLFTATDASGATWVASRAAAPQSVDDDGFVIFGLESPGAPAMGSLTVHAHLVNDAMGTTSNELVANVMVSP